MPPRTTTPLVSDDHSGLGVDRVIDALTRSLARLPPGATKLPSVRELCAELHASPLTVQKALAQLSREGRLIAKPGLGTFRLDAPVPTQPEDTSWQALALGEQRINTDHFGRRLFPEDRPGTVDLTSGYPDDTLQPTGLLASAMTRASRRPGVWGKQSPEGHPQLRAWFAREVGDCISASDVVIVPGGQAALMTSFRALARPGDAVPMEAPTYLGAIVAARAQDLGGAREGFALTQQPGVHVLEKRLALFLAHGAPLVGATAVDGALNLEQRIEASDRLQRDRRDRFSLLAFPSIFLDVSQLEEAPPGMGKAKRRRNRPHLLLWVEQRLEAVVAIRLQDTGEGGQMLLGMLASSVARGVIDRRRRRRPGEGPVIPHISPDPPYRALALRQDPDGGVVAFTSSSTNWPITLCCSTSCACSASC